MKKLLVVILILILPIIAHADKWTVAVYICSDDSTLRDCGFDDFLEMAQIGSDTEVNIVVQMDAYDDSNIYKWSTCKRFYVEKGSIPDTASALMDLGEINMGDPDELIDFGKWVYDNYPADSYMLVIWDHGDGWRTSALSDTDVRGACDDAHGPADPDDPLDPYYLNFTNGEIQDAFLQITTYSGRIKWDIIGFDVCLNQMWENNSACAPYFDVMVASEQNEWLEGWTYDLFLNDLVSASGDLSSDSLASSVVDAYAAGEGGMSGDTQSAIRLSYSPQIDARVNSLALSLMHARDDGHDSEIATVRGISYNVSFPNHIDLYDFCLNIESSTLPAPVKTNASELRTLLDAAVINNFADTASIHTYGTAIYYPSNVTGYSYLYDELDVSKDYFWDNFIRGESFPLERDLKYLNHTIDDTAGNADGDADPGESIDLFVDIGNDGISNAEGVTVTLTVADPYLTFTVTTVPYGDVTSSGSAVNSAPFTFSVAGDCPVPRNITVEMTLTASSGSDTDTFQMVIGRPEILIVNDDNDGDWGDYFTDAADSANYTYAIWRVADSGYPTKTEMDRYSCTVWFTGNDIFNILGDTGEALLESFLDGGGRLFFSSQDYLYDRANKSMFYNEYLKVSSYINDHAPSNMIGASPSSIGENFYSGLDFPLGMYNYIDWIFPLSTAHGYMYSNNSSTVTGLAYTGDYRLVFNAFPLPGIETAVKRGDLFKRVVDWLISDKECLPGDISEESINVYPNPARVSEDDAVLISGLGAPSNITDVILYSIGGNEIAKLDSGLSFTADRDILRWEMSNTTGEKVSSGIYILVISPADGDPITKKLGLIR